MVYLILSILSSTLIIVSFKIIGLRKLDELQAITINYLVAAAYGLLLWSDIPSFPEMMDKPWFNLSLLTGLFFILVFFLFALSADKAGVTITAVASKMSVLIPVMAGFLLFSDTVYWTKVLGILLAIASFYLIFKTDGKTSIRMKFIILPLLLFLGSGINDTFLKFAEHHFLQNDTHVFLTMVFSTALVIGVLLLGYKLITKKTKLSVPSMMMGILLGSFNFGNGYFLIKSMAYFQSSVLFPIVNVSIVSLSTLIGLFVFGERLKWINWIGIILAIFAILLISWRM